MNIEKIMEQAQVFASAWSVVGGPFDGGDAMDVATQEKDELRRMVEESKLEEPAFGIIDPDYARIYTQARIVAWSHGYSCCAQGSFTRDLDLLLVPWAPEAKESANHVIAHLADVCGLRILGAPSEKPHGRMAWTLMLPGFNEVRWVDLSVFQPQSKPAYGPDNPPRLRRADESVEAYREAMGWTANDQPQAKGD